MVSKVCGTGMSLGGGEGRLRLVKGTYMKEEATGMDRVGEKGAAETDVGIKDKDGQREKEGGSSGDEGC